MNNAYQTIKPQDAYKQLQNDTDTILIDVRSDMEFLMVGHPVGAIHIAWIDYPDWDVNKNFTSEVKKLLLGRQMNSTKKIKIFLICRSTNRSKAAADCLSLAGIKSIYVINGGFEGKLDQKHHRSVAEGWRYENLPWEQC
ncbi:MAG: rhodanese-like domain-containing protein [Gammaproteobacteria bacterium]|nr:MAG: rhodanese-like domain-containing protein [Gammaproteobacteria bacterium]